MAQPEGYDRNQDSDPVKATYVNLDRDTHRARTTKPQKSTSLDSSQLNPKPLSNEGDYIEISDPQNVRPYESLDICKQTRDPERVADLDSGAYAVLTDLHPETEPRHSGV